MAEVIRAIVSGEKRGAQRGAQIAVEDFNARIGYQSVGFIRIENEGNEHFEKVIDTGHGVVIFAHLSALGVAYIIRIADARRKPHRVFDHNRGDCPYELATWCSQNKIEKLSVLGFKEEICPGIEQKVFRSVVDLIGLSQITSEMQRRNENGSRKR